MKLKIQQGKIFADPNDTERDKKKRKTSKNQMRIKFNTLR